MATLIISSLILAILLIALSIIWPPDSPWIPIKKEKIGKLLEMAKVGPDDLVYDLGSGDGRILIAAARDFGAQGVGIEIDPARVLWSKLIIKFLGLSPKIKIIRGDFFKADLSSASVVVAYLVPKALKKLRGKFLKELKPRTRIVALRYPLEFLPPILQDEREAIFLYQIPSK